MKIALRRKTMFGDYFITDYKSDIDYTLTAKKEKATIFDTVEDKNDIERLTNSFGFDFKKTRI